MTALGGRRDNPRSTWDVPWVRSIGPGALTLALPLTRVRRVVHLRTAQPIGKEGDIMPRSSRRFTRLAVVASFALSLVAAVAGPANAAVIGPDSFGYTADTASSAFFFDITPFGTSILENDDDTTTAIGFPFPFPFYGTSYDQIFVSPNGLLTFGSANPSFTNEDLDPLVPGPTFVPQPLIAPLWDDWITLCGDVDEVAYVAFPDRLVIQWTMVSHISGCTSDPVTFQVILAADGTIAFLYFDVDTDTGFSNGESATIGIRDAAPPAPVDGRVLQVSFNTPDAVTSGQVICIQPPDAQIPCSSLSGVIGGGGGGDEPHHHRNRTKIVLEGPRRADVEERFNLIGKLQSRRAECEAGMEIKIFRDGRRVGTVVTGQHGRFRLETMLIHTRSADFEARFKGARVHGSRCQPSSTELTVRYAG